MSALTALIAAAGRGERFANGKDKLLSPLAGKPVIAHTVEVFERCPAVSEIVLVVRDDQIERLQDLRRRYEWSKVSAIVPGGERRQDSVQNGLDHVSPKAEIVAIHDGARPLVTEDIILATVEAAKDCGAAVAAVPVVDTLKTADSRSFVLDTPSRDRFFAVQTPQTFQRKLIVQAYRNARDAGIQATDDASLVEAMGHPVRLVMSSYDNIKVTTPTDLAKAEAILAARRGEPPGSSPMRVGCGYDIHKFAENRRLFLGGVEFPGELGLLGHSDADVIIHAICDALLGAAGLGDIGRLYPDTDPKYAGVRSTELLRDVGERLAEAGWRVVNVDATAVAERPKIAGRVSEMCEVTAAALRVSPDQISVKATTAEGLGSLGKGEGIACTAVAMIAISDS